MEKVIVLDIIGIGFGPSNISLAIVLEEEFPNLKAIFFEQEETSQWQAGLLLDNSDIQNHPLRDLATPRNPRSYYSFTNYLFEKGRLFEHLNLGLHFPYRYEYKDYIKWAADHFEHQVKYATRVISIEILRHEITGEDIIEVTTDKNGKYRCKNLIIGTGRTPYIPDILSRLESSYIIHGVKFNKVINQIEKGEIKSIAVVGGSQSAIEILVYLSERFPHLKIHGISRKYGYRLKDTSPFTGEVYFPEFIDIFYNSTRENKQRIKNDLNLTNYAASDADVLDTLYRNIYRDKYFGDKKITIHNSVDLKNATIVDGKVQIVLKNAYEDEKTQIITVDLVVSATGFRDIGVEENQEKYPKILQLIKSHLFNTESDEIKINRDYRIGFTEEKKLNIYLNGLCETSHGMGDAGSISLNAFSKW
ncbi:SidA/IucD/PvdA family monooxygenase [Xenorhabdus siamensis]|uniref:SidA/IucD/PvdA family monooxygenase n=1 Tax=Xenorhabdus siamensis TaxID=3136254 RepID=UPI0030F49587